MSQEYVELPPDVHVLESIRVDRGSWSTLAAEAVDNSFDAGARNITVNLGEVVEIEDDGSGITRDREDALFRLGEHRAMATTRLGRFGIGIKYHAVSAGDVFRVHSTSIDGSMHRRVDWSEIIKKGRWVYPSPKWDVRNDHPRMGTTITISRLRWSPATEKDIRSSLQDLSQKFYPALADGRTITVNGSSVQVLSEPEMRDTIEGIVEITPGKSAHVRAGMLANEAAPLFQIQVSYGHRVILSKTGFGCGAYTGLRAMFGRVHLNGSWTLARFKDNIVDEDSAELEEAIEELLRPILEQCQSTHLSAEIDEIAQQLNDMLPPELVSVRPTRSTDPRQLLGHHKGSNEQHRPAHGKETPSGPGRSKRPSRNQILIEFAKNLHAEFGYGRFLPGRPGRIQLALDNPHIVGWMANRDRLAGLSSLYAMAMTIYLQERDREDYLASREPYLVDQPFGQRVWHLVERQRLEARAALE